MEKNLFHKCAITLNFVFVFYLVLKNLVVTNYNFLSF